MMNDISASAAVTETLPVAVAPQGSRPSRLEKRMKKKSVITKGAYFSPPWPMFGITTWSRRKRTIASMTLCRPRGAPVCPVRRAVPAAASSTPIVSSPVSPRKTTCFVGVMSTGPTIHDPAAGRWMAFPKGSSISRESWMWCRMSKPCSSAAACSPPTAPCSASAPCAACSTAGVAPSTAGPCSCAAPVRAARSMIVANIQRIVEVVIGPPRPPTRLGPDHRS
jgi:hypothetical protein